MEQATEKIDPSKKLWITNWAINNRTSVYLLALLLTLFGVVSYQALPKEQFPEVVFPFIIVQTVYPGASPQDMENLVTRELEQEINTIAGVKKITSNSIQDFSVILVEFDVNENPDLAKQAVKDAVDRARGDLPNDLDRDPEVLKIEVNDQPIMFINVAGDFEDAQLKRYAEDLQEAIERINAINRVDLVGAREREIQVNLDLYRMQAAGISISDVENAIRAENVTISSGNVQLRELNYAMRVSGEFESVTELRNIIVRSPLRAEVPLSEIADVQDTYEERESYARLAGQKTITLNVIKRGGENLITTAEEIRRLVEELKSTSFPEALQVDIFGDTSIKTEAGLNELMHTIVLGVILVTFVLMFFMGITNALFVSMSIPLTMFMVFIAIPNIDFTLNIVVLFALLLALGILVDNAIVVIENTHRLFGNGRNRIGPTANYAAREVFVPVFGGMLVIIAPFAPMLFWPGIIGKFMYYLPATLIITLSSSLFVAFFFNPVFATTFMKPHGVLAGTGIRKHLKLFRNVGILLVLSLLMYGAGATSLGSFLLIVAGLMLLTRFVLEPAIRYFQARLLPRLDNGYARLVSWLVRGKRPRFVLLGALVLLIASVMFFGASSPKVEFFPDGEPNNAWIYMRLPIGTETEYTDSISRIVERRALEVLQPDMDIVEAVITNVAVGAGDPQPEAFEQGTRPELAKITVAFVDYELRHGKSSREVLLRLREALTGLVPGVNITVDKEANGPPQGKPVSIEIASEDFPLLIATSKRLQRYLDSLQIPGIEAIKSDLELDKPELLFNIDRERANRLGISTATVGLALRTAINGNEVSKFREDEDQHPIVVRLDERYRNNLTSIQNMNITFLDFVTGQFRSIPASAVADIEYSSTFGGIKRKNLKRVVTLNSNLLDGYNANEVNAQIAQALQSFEVSNKISINPAAGVQADQAETVSFLGMAALSAMLLIIIILVTIFNSIGRTAIIGLQVIFSIIGVMLGYAISGNTFSVVMSGVGMIALFGIVVNNGIILIEFMDELKKRVGRTRVAVTEAGRIRLKPVLLTKLATILGLIPLAIGFNINFESLLATGDPKIFFGGDNVAFWSPMALTIIYGLLFATFLTLFVVPCMYVIYYGLKVRYTRWRNRSRYPRVAYTPPTDAGGYNSNGHATHEALVTSTTDWQ
jgi:multidrug efflux pump subunit AcrB